MCRQKFSYMSTISPVRSHLLLLTVNEQQVVTEQQRVTFTRALLTDLDDLAALWVTMVSAFLGASTRVRDQTAL